MIENYKSLFDIPTDHLESKLDRFFVDSQKIKNATSATEGGRFKISLEVQIVLYELNKRLSSQMIKSSEENSNNTRKYSKRSVFIAIVALLIALGSFSFSIVDYFGDKQWQQDQMAGFQELNQSIHQIDPNVTIITPYIPQER